ncbi:transcriptional regulator, GntR family [Desulfocicer vacuolatum DSM 3385]|uniref:Transcriptional regulator, GntR family n=1 Tax=Desulfocicer vacuolatum DSM 3385 TaxID=1121400 RepID=A0A1W2B910_9BACT|nr:GntR family transcriptional regulator [Desulfocicer vacuolatum]SMC69182.1 transcriptional regulator, GntR family [Desulfocicer vacuolatum DSM 3385]
MLNTESPLPLYHQLAEILISKIRSGEYASGTRIPAETALAKTYGIGRPTARQAVDILTRKGLVKRRRGAGTFVAEQRDDVDLFSLAGTSSAFHRKGIDIDIQMLAPVSLKSVSGEHENPFSGGEAYCIIRLTMARKLPVLLETIYLHPTLFSGIEHMDLTGKSLAGVVSDKFYMVPDRGRQNFRVIRPDKFQRKFLKLGMDEPVLLVKRFLDFPQAENAVYSELLCRTDQFVFSQTLGGNIHG